MRNEEAIEIATREGLIVPEAALPYETWVRRSAGALTCRPFNSDPTPEPAEGALLAALYPVSGVPDDADAGYPAACWWPYTRSGACSPEHYPTHPGLFPLLASLYAVAWRPGSPDKPHGSRMDFAGTAEEPVVLGTLTGGADLSERFLAFYVRTTPRSLACAQPEELACLWAAIASQVWPPSRDPAATRRAAR